jgi:hypothetical protein
MRGPRLSVAFIIAAGVALGGCFDKFTALVWFPHSSFVTITDVDLLDGQEHDSGVIARLPKGTVVNPIGQSGSHCNSCMRVATPEGVGWLYTRYMAPIPETD